MSAGLTAILVAVFLWWFSTGAILMAVGLPRRLHAQMVWGSLPLAIGAGWLFVVAAGMESLAGVYLGFGAALAVWGWHELAFLTGIVTGPRRRPWEEGSRIGRFPAAVAALAWHELALVVTGAVLWWLSEGLPNHTGLWTFLVLLIARISAKLNVFLGVPNLTEEFMPEPLQHLKSYFRKRPMNMLFPISVTGLTLIMACWMERAYDASYPQWEAVGFVLLAGLTALALLEHWLMVLPVRDAALWQWLLRADDVRRGAVQRPEEDGTRPSEQTSVRRGRIRLKPGRWAAGALD